MSEGDKRDEHGAGFMTNEETCELFNQRCLQLLGVSGEKFIEQLDSGYYDDNTAEEWPHLDYLKAFSTVMR